MALYQGIFIGYPMQTVDNLYNSKYLLLCHFSPGGVFSDNVIKDQLFSYHSDQSS